MGVEPVRWGFLSTAKINDRVLDGARKSDKLEIAAVASRDLGRAEAYARERGIPRAHGSYEALLADPEIEAVYVSLPNSLHQAWTVRALEAGKHVLCEKPYSRHPDEVVEAFDLAESCGLILSEAFMWRHHPQVAKLTELRDTIGRLQTIRASFCFVLDRDPDIRLRPDLDGGALMDVGCYCVSGARYAAGEEPDLVFGFAVEGRSGVDERFTGVLRFPSGVIAEFTAAFTTNHRGLELIGSSGSVLFGDPWQSMPATIVVEGVETPLEPQDPYKCEIENVSAAIRGVAEPRLGRADALGQARTIAALYRSAREGTAIRP